MGRRMQHIAPRVITDVAAAPWSSDGVTRGAHQGMLGVVFDGGCPSSRWATLPTNQVGNGVHITRMAKTRNHGVVLWLSNGSGMHYNGVLRQCCQCFVFHTTHALCFLLLHVVFGGQCNFTVNGTVFQPIGQRLERGFSPW